MRNKKIVTYLVFFVLLAGVESFFGKSIIEGLIHSTVATVVFVLMMEYVSKLKFKKSYKEKNTKAI
jgi:uncharacterized membrane-anchored protein